MAKKQVKEKSIEEWYEIIMIDGEWKVIRYDKTDVNVEDEATIANNGGTVNQPTTLAECTALNYN